MRSENAEADAHASLPMADGARPRPATRECAFLCEVNALLHDSLDHATVLERAAWLAVPYLADACIVEHAVAGPDGPVSVAVADLDVTRRARLREVWERAAARVPSEHPILGPGPADEPQLAADLDPDALGVCSGDPVCRHLLGLVAPRSILVVPLATDGGPVGAITMLLMSDRRYGEVDRAVAEGMARRAVLALENARRHAEALAGVHEREAHLALVAHELKTPLTALQLNLGLLLDAAHAGGLPAMPPERVLDALRAADRQIRRLRKLVRDLLDTARATQGKLGLERTRLSLARLVREIVESLQPTVARHGLQLDADGLDSFDVLGDAARLEQVVINLLDNAVKYSPDGGRVGVRLAREGASVRLSVTDEGIGIPQDERAALFDRFFRCSNVPAGCSGLGLGLFVCHEIVASHGGRITVESEPGRGTSFHVTLPAQP